MPTYEYACRACGQHVEVVQSFRDDPLTTCPSCRGQLRKVYAAAGIIFKGSGYYVNDSRKSASKGGDNGAKKADVAASDGGSGESGAEKSEKSEKSEKGGKKDRGDSAKPAPSTSSSDAPSAKSA